MSDNPQDLARFIARQKQKRHLAAIWAGLAGLREGMAVLDIGAGPGVLSAEYARLVGPNGVVYALEPKTALIERLPNLIAVSQDATAPINLPRAPDVVFLTDTLHHAADPAAVLRSVRAICGAHSVVFITEYDPAQPGLMGAKPHRRLPRARLVELLAAAGFSHDGVFDTMDEHYAVRARRG